MKTLRVLVALLTNDNDYQIEQAASATQMASKLGVQAKIVYADNDAVNQSTQILKAIQAAPEERPDAVVFEPVGGASHRIAGWRIPTWNNSARARAGSACIGTPGRSVASGQALKDQRIMPDVSVEIFRGANGTPLKMTGCCSV
jgi:hypothetical protein